MREKKRHYPDCILWFTENEVSEDRRESLKHESLHDFRSMRNVQKSYLVHQISSRPRNLEMHRQRMREVKHKRSRLWKNLQVSWNPKMGTVLRIGW